MATDADYLNLLTSWNSQRPNFVASVQASIDPFVQLINFTLALPGQFDLDAAIGVQLDQVGEWVGISRNVNLPVTGVYFAFDTAGVGFDQGTWTASFDYIDGIVTLADAPYRLLIKGKIAANQWDGTIPGMIDALEIAFAGYAVSFYVDDHYDMTMALAVVPTTAMSLDAITIALLAGQYIPLRPDAVAMEVIFPSVLGGPIFGFDVESNLVSGFDVGSWEVQM